MKNIYLLLLCAALVACSPSPSTSERTAAPPTFAPAAATSAPTTQPTAAPTLAPAPATVYPAIAPETLGQLRLLWNVNFPGDFTSSSSCNPKETECTLTTNISAYAFSANGNTLAAAVCLGTRTQDQSQPDQDHWACTGESAIIIYDTAIGAERGRLIPASLPLSLAFYQDGTLLAAGLANSQIELWDLASNELADTLSGAPAFLGVSPLAFTPDGNMLISGSRSGFELQLWDWRSSELLTTIEPHIGIGISPDGRSLATLHLVNYPNYKVRVYDLAQLDSFVEIPQAGQYAPTEFSFNPLNGWLSSVEFGSNSYLANFWDTESIELVAALDFNREFEAGVLYDLNSGGFTSEGYFLLTRYGQLTAAEAQPEATGLSETLWACGFALADMEANQIFFSLPMLYDECTGPEFIYDMGATYQAKILSPDGRFIAADDGFGNLRVWGIDANLPAIPPECSGDC